RQQHVARQVGHLVLPRLAHVDEVDRLARGQHLMQLSNADLFHANRRLSMEYRNLGRSGLKVSTLCLGAMTFGEPAPASMMHGIAADEPPAHAMIDRALAAGVNFIDTADVYGNDGLSERVIGRWFGHSGKRDQVVLATKFRFTMGTGPNSSGAARVRIVRTVEDSLRRLQTDRIELYQIHMQDLDTPEEETLRALDD